ncbi:MAG: hypothetical protein V8T19_03950 [Senegalimassilia anaerobia]
MAMDAPTVLKDPEVIGAGQVLIGAGEDGEDDCHGEHQDDAHDAQQRSRIADRVAQLGERAAFAIVVAPEAAQHALGAARCLADAHGFRCVGGEGAGSLHGVGEVGAFDDFGVDRVAYALEFGLLAVFRKHVNGFVRLDAGSQHGRHAAAERADGAALQKLSCHRYLLGYRFKRSLLSHI